MPLLQMSPLLGILRATWQNERSECLANISKNEDLAKRQVKKIYAFFQELNENTQFGWLGIIYVMLHGLGTRRLISLLMRK